MFIEHKSAQNIRIDKRNHVEKPLLDQLAGLGWEVSENEKEAAGV